MSAATDVKARCLLRDGQVTVTEIRPGLLVKALVAGSAPDPYLVTWSAQGGWRCCCPCRTVRCAHVVAVATVTDVTGARTATAAHR